MNLVICASSSFYEEVIQLSDTLEKQGLTVILPHTAAKMKQAHLENEEAKMDWSVGPVGHHGKSLLIREHFEEIVQSDAILVMNFEKHGQAHYIGPNVLMEMAVAFSLNKPIYVLNGIPKDSPLIDEILGLEPIFLEGDSTKIKG